MTRRPRCRCISQYPDHWLFSPDEVSSDETVVMSLDEFETIRLIDKEGMTILQVTHSNETAKYGTRTVIIDSGKIVDSGK